MDDLPSELSKRISRRQFLFGSRRGDPSPLPLVVGLGALGVGIIGWGSPKAINTVSDLPNPKILRADVQAITILANQAAAEANVTLSPALTGAIADWLIQTAVQRPSAGFTILTQVFADLTTLSNLRLRIARLPALTHGLTGTTNLGFANGTDAESNPGDPHNHALSLLTDDHSHSGPATHSNTGQAQTTYNVFWQIGTKG